MNAAKRWLAMAVLVAAPAAWADLTVAGVKYEDGADLAGTRLVLNGAGIRTKVIFKVYTAGLYLPKKAATPEEAVAQPGAKRISLTMLREVDADEFGAAFAKGIEENNDAATLARLAPAIQRMNRIFAEHKKLAQGDHIAIDWVPGAGTQIRVKGAAQGEPIRDADFYPALLRIWLGAAPVDRTLKEALLGKPA